MANFYRWLVALSFGAALAYGIHNKEDASIYEKANPLHRKYGTIIGPELLMAFFLIVFISVAATCDIHILLESFFSLICSIFISIIIYYAIFISFLPILRKYVSAKAVALMWLIPNYTYITVQSLMTLDKPWLVLDIGKISLRSIALIWSSIALIIFTVYIIKHFMFRFKLLRHAKPVESEPVRNLWEAMQQRYEIEKHFIKIVTSDSTKTPLSIGLFRRTTVLVLPHTNYTEEELKLIFKHELIHILRSDSQTKLSIAFCNAICWFNPLMWIAMKKCTEDLELSCDEYVIEDLGGEEKNLYGDLILSTAGNEAGFTTCLSASAEALKYRLTNIYKPKRRFAGNIIIGTLVAVMVLTSGSIALSYNHQTVADIFYDNAKGASIDKCSILFDDGNSNKSYSCDDPDALSNYIMNLKIYEVTGYYDDADSDEKSLRCNYLTDEGEIVVRIGDNRVEFSILNKPTRRHTYYLDEPVNWHHIMLVIQNNIHSRPTIATHMS